MSIPNYQDFMNVVLEVYAKEGEILNRTDIIDVVADKMGLSEEDKKQTIKSGEQVISSRIYWASYYMFRAGLLERIQRGIYKITDVGLNVCKSGEKINNDYLMRYKSFVDFIETSHTSAKPSNKSIGQIQHPTCDNTDPEEMLENAINDLNALLEDDILSNLEKVDPKQFERIVVDVMESMDYGIGSVTPYVADGGIDGIIDEDELGLSKIYLQAKRYVDNKVNEKEMRNFVGALATHNVKKGVFITTSDFAPKAIAASNNAHGYTIALINGTKLAKLMRKYNLGAKSKKNYDIKEFDASYFDVL